jgi:carboxymethylenebutenolidase
MSANPEFESLVPMQSFDRRSFLATSLGAGFALAVQPVMAQTAIKTDDEGLVAGEIKVPVKDGEMVAYRALPQSVLPNRRLCWSFPRFLALHEYIRDVCRRLAKLGYCAIAPELFARQGDPRQYSSIPEILSKITGKTPDALVMADLDACVVWACSRCRYDQPIGDYRILLGWPYYLAIQRAQSPGQSWRGLVWPIWLGRSAICRLNIRRRSGGPTECAGTRSLRRPRYRYPAGVGGSHGEGPESSGSAAARLSEIHRLRQRAACISRRLSDPVTSKAEAEDGWKRMLAWFRKNGV